MNCIIDDELEEHLLWRWRHIQWFESSRMAVQVGDELLTPAQMGEWLQLSESTIHELCRTRAQQKRNPLPFFKVGRAVRFNKTEIMKWLSQLEAEPSN